MNRRELLKGILVGVAASCVPKAVIAAALPASREVSLYEVAGQTIFPTWDLAGCFSSMASVYPFIKELDGSIVVYCHAETMEQRLSTATEDDCALMLKRAMAAFDEAYTLSRVSMQSITEEQDGGPLPFAGKLTRFVPRIR